MTFYLPLLLLISIAGIFSGWIEFRFEGFGLLPLSLASAVVLALLAIIGTGVALATAIVASVLGQSLFGNARKANLAGEAAKSMLLLSIPLGVTIFSLDRASLSGTSSYIVLFACGIFLIVDAVVRIFSLVLSERIGLSRAVPLVFTTLYPYYFLTPPLVLLLAISREMFGLLGLVVGVVVVAELCYPWKLLNEQSVLLFRSLKMISQAVDLKDPYTSNHSRRVADLAVKVARRMGLPESEIPTIRTAALMHDIGKIGIPVDIIRKPQCLTLQEMAVVRKHPIVGAELIESLDEKAAEIVRHSHEHFDGTGYPAGLRGRSIPTGSRIILVVDAFDALTTDRPYRQGRSHFEALEVIKQHSGTQFDPEIVAALESLVGREVV